MSFCPFINDKCKGNQCMMWSNEDCLVKGFFQGTSFIPSEIEFPDEPTLVESRQEAKIPQWLQLATPKDIVEMYFEFVEKEFPDSERQPYGIFNLFLQTKGIDRTWGLPAEVSLKTSKARAFIEIEREKRRESERQLRLDREQMQVDALAVQFLDWMEDKLVTKVYKKDVTQFLSELNIDLLWETQSKIVNQAKKLHDEKHIEKVEAEKRELPSLIDQCIDWARANGFSRLAKADIDSFLLEYKLTITDETKRSLYSLANTKLKSKK